ncbi:MAG: carbohydrate ABC transporter permease [Thiotrichales bacterium]|nr:carbohydrate ABC transporter permease [Thiotrichales bacterium]MCY4286688.1 carbohydrate ABC transporter permease [Thiotrichales bacterium]MCY4349235.1 carbohydrate ABC transporter permease [Thiotrichales bacterium]
MTIPERTLLRRLFTAQDLTSMAPAAKVVVYALLLSWLMVVLFPLYWLFITSFKLPVHVNDGPDFLPFIDFKPSGHAWRYIFVELGNDTLRPYLSSVIVASCSTVLCVLIGAFAAYALVRIQYRVKVGNVAAFLLFLAGTVYVIVNLGAPWPVAAAVASVLFVLFATSVGRSFQRSLGNDDILFWIISNRILPPVVVVLPVYLMFQRLGLLDTHVALIATYTAINLPIVVWLMRDFFAGIPVDLEESAQIDGASRFRIFFTIVLPLGRPGLAATSLLILILAWNEYLLALFISTADAQTMPMLVAAQNATRGPQWWYMSVLIVIMIAPIVLTAAMLQRHIARGLMVGAIKG